MLWKTSVLPAGSVSVHLPFASEAVPLVVPFSKMPTPITGSPFVSVTVPDARTRVWAEAESGRNRQPAARLRAARNLKMFLLIINDIG